MKMNKRVYGVLGIRSIMSNWNADFTKMPKTTGDNRIYGSDKPVKFTMRRLWNNEGEEVLYIKTYKDDDKVSLKGNKDRYKQLFDEDPKSGDEKKILNNLFKCLDVMNFGAAFLVKPPSGSGSGVNLSITGAVQIGQGFNKYENTEVITQPILSPFPSDEKKGQGSIGEKTITDEAHYFYPFSINPQNYNEYIDILKQDNKDFEGYTVKDYEKFKTASLVSVTAFKSDSKSGCENEFALFVELVEGSKLYLPDLAQFIKFNKGDKKDLIDISDFKFLNIYKDQIENIEIYYAEELVEIVEDVEFKKYFDEKITKKSIYKGYIDLCENDNK